MKNQLSLKYTFFSILLISIITIVFTTIFVNKHTNIQEIHLKQEADVYIDVFESAIAEEVVANRIDNVNKNIYNLMKSSLIEYILVVNNDGKIIAESNSNNESCELLEQNKILKNVDSVNEKEYLENNQSLLVVEPFKLGNEKHGVIIVSYTKLTLRAEIARFTNIAVILGLIFIFLGSLFTHIVIQRISHPLLKLTTLTNEISHGRFGETIDINTNDEISLLTESFNRMSGQIEEANASLLQAKEDAERFNSLKSEFLAQMSHEIRTPINTMLNYATLAEEEVNVEKNPECVSYFNVMKNAGKRIIRTIDLILNMSEIEKGSYQPEFKKFNLLTVVKDLHFEFLKNAEKKGLDLQLINDAKITDVFADKYTITQIFQNIIDNAIKYTDSGFVKILLSNDSGNIIIKVKDSGVGISQAFQETMFEAFRQEEQGYTRKYEGAGLGLALVANYCILNKAQIKVESEKDKGTTFIISLKL